MPIPVKVGSGSHCTVTKPGTECTQVAWKGSRGEKHLFEDHREDSKQDLLMLKSMEEIRKENMSRIEEFMHGLNAVISQMKYDIDLLKKK